MRRIPRPSRAIDASASVAFSVRQGLTPPCAHLRTSTAAFSTTAPHAFLIPAQKQDKKKHQQFVRRWQKRLLGDSEPIGAHVDPYDPTSPVRIAPEEQGEYEEVLEEQMSRDGKKLMRRDEKEREESDQGQYLYLPAEELGADTPGSRLMHIGHEKWLQQKLEGDMAKEYEKLTLQTYTPLTLGMANDIEELTGTPYTLRDGNLMMAQTVHEMTGRPYTKHDFGLHISPTVVNPKLKFSKPEFIRNSFIQAVAEVYALKEAGMDMDLAKLPNRGVYDKPQWIENVKLCKTDSGEFALSYPRYRNAEDLLKVIQSAPEWDSAQEIEQDELLVDEAEELLGPALQPEPTPVMDPATPVFKRAAVVKMDPEKKPFDFMSNRPVPRAKPVAADKVEEVVEVVEPVVQPAAPLSRLAELTSAFEASTSAISELRHTVLTHHAQKLVDDIAAPRKAARSSSSSSSTPEQVEEVKWRHVPLNDLNLKFALFKRLYQLTRVRISDPHLNSCDTLGDLYGHLRAAAKPHPTSLMDAIGIEGTKAQQARGRAKQQAGPSRRRADLGDLFNLGNVELRRSKATKTEKRTRTGIEKVIDYAFYERGLHKDQSMEQRAQKVGTPHPLGLKLGGKKYFEGTRAVPEYGRPVPSGAANLLIKHTRKTAEEVQAEQLES